MRENTSYRLEAKIKRLIKRNGGGSFVEGCVLLAHLSGLTSFVQKLSLEYELKGFPDLSEVYLAQGAALSNTPQEQILILKTESGQIDYDRIIKTVADIPEDTPVEYRRAVEDLLDVLGEREELNI